MTVAFSGAGTPETKSLALGSSGGGSTSFAAAALTGTAVITAIEANPTSGQTTQSTATVGWGPTTPLSNAPE